MTSENGEKQDQTLHCVDCGADFVWTAGEQMFFAEKKLSPPRRCQGCRTVRRHRREQIDADRQADYQSPDAQEWPPDEPPDGRQRRW